MASLVSGCNTQAQIHGRLTVSSRWQTDWQIAMGKLVTAFSLKAQRQQKKDLQIPKIHMDSQQQLIPLQHQLVMEQGKHAQLFQRHKGSINKKDQNHWKVDQSKHIYKFICWWGKIAWWHRYGVKMMGKNWTHTHTRLCLYYSRDFPSVV